MKISLLPWGVMFLTACGSAPPCEAPPCVVQAGFAGRFLVSRLILPTSKSDFAVDLDGDGKPDDQIGNVLGALKAQNLDPQSAVDAAFSSGAQRLIVDVLSTDVTQSDAAGVSVAIGEPGEGSPAELCGALAGGAFASQPSCDAPAAMMLKLAFLLDAEAPLTAVRASYRRDADGTLRGQINGALPAAQIGPVIWPALAQALTRSIEEWPQQSQSLSTLFDNGGTPTAGDAPCPNDACRNLFGPDAGQCAAAGDGVISTCEVGSSAIIRDVIAPDVRLAGLDRPRDALSFGVGFVAAPESD